MSEDNYQQMPDEPPPPAAIIVTIPDLAPPGMSMDDPDTPDEVSGDDGGGSSEPSPDEPRYGIEPWHNYPGGYDAWIGAGSPQVPETGWGGDPAAGRAAQPEEVPSWHRPSGAPMDEGFYVWLSHHGVNPGDPAQKARIAEFKSNYLSLPETDHAEYRAVGKSNPSRYQFDLASWADAPDLPPPVPPAPSLGDPGSPEDPPYTPPPGEPGPQPTPMPVLPLPGEGAQVTQSGTGDLADLGLTPARTTQYDWEGRRVGRRVWDARQGRYV